MTVEHTTIRAVHKPWGAVDARPWSRPDPTGEPIGELWFQRSLKSAPEPALLLKLLFTTQPLSIQVHPDDSFAQAACLPHGKTEAWYILSAAPDARIARGLKRPLSTLQLRAAIEDGSIAAQIEWRRVDKDDVILVPAGTIHSIGAGLVVAEIQQRSDATFRLFDHGRGRELHVENAVAVADANPAPRQAASMRLTAARMSLTGNPYFQLERLDLPPGSTWEFRTDTEAWLLVIEGDARIGGMNTFIGESIFIDRDQTRVNAGTGGAKVLAAYVGARAAPDLLVGLNGQVDDPPVQITSQSLPLPASASGRPLGSVVSPW